MSQPKTVTSEDAMSFEPHRVLRDDEPEAALYQSLGGFVVAKGFSVNKKQAGELASMLDDFSKS